MPFRLLLALILGLAATALPAVELHLPPGRIAITHDGNQHDLDDVGALPMNAAMLWAAGAAGRLVHLDHSNHLGSNNAAMEQLMKDSAAGAISRFGLDPARVFDCQTQLAQAIANFKAEADRSTATDPLWLICSGPMETSWRYLNATDPARRQFIRCVSHSTWNETHADTTQMTHTWAKMKTDFPSVIYYDIIDQNTSDGDNDWSTPLAKWYWLRDSSYEPFRWLYSRNQFTTKFDPSDSGMVYWLLSGGPDGGDQRSGWPEAKTLLEGAIGGVPAQAVSSLTLIDATLDAPVPGYDPIPDGAVLELWNLPASLTLRANTSPATVGSVRFGVDANATYLIENVAPYALAGDTNGDYNPWKLGAGVHTVTATPYSAAKAGGTAGTALRITFSIVTAPAGAG